MQINATTASAIVPLQPRRIKKGMTVYNAEGEEEFVMDIKGICGQWQFTTVRVVDGVNKFTNHVHDEHDYGGGVDALPLLYKNKPKGRG